MQELKFNESNRWSFVGEGWTTRGDAGEELTALGSWNTGPNAYRGQHCANDDIHLALRTDRAYVRCCWSVEHRRQGGNERAVAVMATALSRITPTRSSTR